MNYIIIKSLDSTWTFDEVLKRYMRLPLNESPREFPEWSDERAGPVQDGIWHKYKDYWITCNQTRLIILPVDTYAFWAPLTPEVFNVSFSLTDEIYKRMCDEQSI